MVTLSPTLNIERRIALIHVKHIGPGADVKAGIFGLHVTDGQDTVEVHCALWKLPAVLTGPHQGVSRGLRDETRSGDYIEGR